MSEDNGSEPVDNAWNEYSLLQDKIDKIGEFRFKVQGWAVTLVVALLVSGLASGLPGPCILVGMPLIFAFQILEGRQAMLGRIFAARIMEIELNMRHQQEGFITPAVATRLASEINYLRRGPLLNKLKLHSTRFLYYTMYVLVVMAFIWKTLLAHDVSEPQNVELTKPIDVNLEAGTNLKKLILQRDRNNTDIMTNRMEAANPVRIVIEPGSELEQLLNTHIQNEAKKWTNHAELSSHLKVNTIEGIDPTPNTQSREQKRAAGAAGEDNSETPERECADHKESTRKEESK